MKEKKPKKKFGEGYKTYDISNGFGSVDQWREAFEKRMNYATITITQKEENKSILQPLFDAKDIISLKTAYRNLMKQYHPDVNGNTEENNMISQMLNDTYFDLKEKY